MSAEADNGMGQAEREGKLINAICLVLAILFLIGAGYQIMLTGFRGGVDDIFLVLTCLTLAGIFAINPALTFFKDFSFANDEGTMESNTAHEHEDHAGGGTKLYLIVWGGLLVLTAIEVFLGYIHLNLGLMLTILMGLSLVKAAMIIAYFMHLKFERMSLILTIIPAMVIVISLLAIFFPDSLRLLQNGVNR